MRRSMKKLLKQKKNLLKQKKLHSNHKAQIKLKKYSNQHSKITSNKLKQPINNKLKEIINNTNRTKSQGLHEEDSKILVNQENKNRKI